MNSLFRYRSKIGALKRYRLMAFIVGVGLLVLTFVGIPLQIWAHDKIVVEIVGPLHGYLYLVYLAAAFDLARRERFPINRLLMMLAAGLVPFLAFIIEHLIVRAMAREIALESETANR